MKKIGLTGGIGSGKSVVGRVLEAMNFPVYYSDDRSKYLVDEDLEIRKELTELLGAEIYLNDKLDRPFLAERIFRDSALLQKVNAIIHPKVRAHFSRWAEAQNSPIVFNEAAILFETGAYQLMDATILVTAPEEIKIKRVMLRDKVSKEQVLERMSKQFTDEQKIALADFVLINDDIQPLLQQIENTILKLTIDN